MQAAFQDYAVEKMFPIHISQTAYQEIDGVK